MSMYPLFPNVNVQLVGENGNAYSILGRVIKAMRRGKVPDTSIEDFKTEATKGDYDNLLQTVMKYVSTDADEEEDN